MITGSKEFGAVSLFSEQVHDIFQHYIGIEIFSEKCRLQLLRINQKRDRLKDFRTGLNQFLVNPLAFDVFSSRGK